MGSHPYWYYIDYQTDINTTLQTLRQREFGAGRYSPVIPMFLLHFPITDSSPAPGARHSSIEEAMEASGDSGTGSILDIFKVSTIPFEEAMRENGIEEIEIFYTDENDRVNSLIIRKPKIEMICTTFPLSFDELIRLLGTNKPTHDLVESVIIRQQQNPEAVEEFWNSIDRGTGRHIVIYDGERPAEIFFIGYSVD